MSNETELNRQLKSEKLLSLKESLKSKKIFFFVGSGISLMSGLPSVPDILSRTCQKWIPDIWRDPAKKHLLEVIQPELFYSILLDCNCGDTGCLNMWSSFHPQKWEDSACGIYHPKPAVEHLFIAAYSYAAQVPIFTTNYDTMLEQACKDLGIRSKTLIFSDDPPAADLFAAQWNDSVPRKTDTVFICKIHGDICHNKNGFDPNALKTTMAEITKRNDPWLQFLYEMLDKKMICFAGYSGRDIDYFPFIKERHPAAFWMEEKDQETFDNADSIHAVIVKRYPSAFFMDTYEEILRETSFASKIHTALEKNRTDSKAHKEDFLNQIQSEISGRKGTPEELHAYQTFFWMIFSERTGSVADVYSISKQLFHADIYNRLSSRQQIMALNSFMMANRENANFRIYRKQAFKLLQLSRKQKNKPEMYNALIQIIGSYQMDVPHHLHFPIPVRLCKIDLLICVRLCYAAINTYFLFLKKWNRKEYNDSLHLIQECFVRTLAIDTALAKKIKCGWAISFVNRRLIKLHDSAYAAGNYITVVGTCKYLDRLSFDHRKDWKNEGKNAARMVSEISAISILFRGTPESLEAAKKNSNTLNTIKSYLYQAHIQYRSHQRPLLSDSHQKDMIRCMRKVESRSLRRAFQYILKTYFSDQLI